MMANKAIILFTYKSLDNIVSRGGGSGNWKLKRINALQCPYAVLARNAHDKRVEDTKPHRTGFLVGRVSDVVPSPESGRWIVKFSEYAEIDMPELWPGERNPVAYGTLEDLGIKLPNLKFKPMPAGPKDKPDVATSQQSPLTSPPATLTIAEARIALAATFGVKPEAIEITIRG
jgi:hypothetical protein